jgi:hypothetical protein
VSTILKTYYYWPCRVGKKRKQFYYILDQSLPFEKLLITPYFTYKFYYVQYESPMGPRIEAYVSIKYSRVFLCELKIEAVYVNIKFR